MWSASIVLVQVYLLGAVLEAGPAVGHHSPTSHISKRSIHTAGKPDYTITPGVGTHKVFAQQTTWNTARRTCEQDGAHLLIINSVAEAEAIGQLFNRSGIEHLSWVGVHDFYHEDEFVTIHDEPLVQTGYYKWGPGEPDNRANTEHCLLINDRTGLLDVPCDHRHYFICEIPEVSAYTEKNENPKINNNTLADRILLK